MGAIQCFLLSPTELRRRDLRRYSSSSYGSCPGKLGFHNAFVTIDPEYEGPEDASGDTFPHNDPRWPTHCDCGYEFREHDQWQHGVHHLYRRADNAELVLLGEAPPGAMYWAPWLADMRNSRYHTARGGGPHLIVVTPDGAWDVDTVSHNGEGWDRTGDPPNVTASPSIQGHHYHGHLKGGVLVDA